MSTGSIPIHETLSGLPLEKILEKVENGEQYAFTEFYDRLAPRILGLTLRLLRDPALAEEVTQEVFLEIWQHADNFDPDRGNMISWILTIAHRRAVDRIRSHQASHDRELRIGIRDLVGDVADVAENTETRAASEDVYRAMTHLSSRQQEAITLAYYGGYTQQEIAAILGIPVGTVKTRLRDGMIALRNALGIR